MTRNYIRKKVRKGNKTHNEFGKEAFDRILRTFVKKMNKTLKLKYNWNKVVCGIITGLPSRLDNKSKVFFTSLKNVSLFSVLRRKKNRFIIYQLEISNSKKMWIVESWIFHFKIIEQ